LSIACFE